MLIPVILSGGAGTRLWPVSREGHPKPFMKLADGESLLVKTYRRAAAAVGNEGESEQGELLTVTNRDYYFMSKDEFGCAGLGNQQSGVFMLEPTGRNTAPAVAMAAHHVADKYGRDALMLVLAADHLVQDQQGFSAAVASAIELAREGKLVTFGIVPTSPDTGFGYIEAGEPVGDRSRSVALRREARRSEGRRICRGRQLPVELGNVLLQGRCHSRRDGSPRTGRCDGRR